MVIAVAIPTVEAFRLWTGAPKIPRRRQSSQNCVPGAHRRTGSAPTATYPMVRSDYAEPIVPKCHNDEPSGQSNSLIQASMFRLLPGLPDQPLVDIKRLSLSTCYAHLVPPSNAGCHSLPRSSQTPSGWQGA
jgi:hypothetical protein